MPEVIPLVLWAWVPVTLGLFWKLPANKAAAASLVGGWLLLPTAVFPIGTSRSQFPYWIMPACLPADLWSTKARLIGVALWLGVMAFDPRVWVRFRPSFFDLPILGWCLVPLASGWSNGVSLMGALADSSYLFLAWGTPYLLGRFYFADPAGLKVLARTIIGGGLISIPFCLVEWLTSPIVYRMLYGFHPYQWDGSRRYVGFRPIVFLEHGNQLGAWMASAAIVATWVWRSGLLPRFWRLPGSVVVSLLVTIAVLTQSVGAVVLLLLGMASMEIIRRLDRRWPIIVVLALPLLFLGARATNLFDAKSLVMRTEIGRKLAEASIKADRQSFGWRLQVEERAVKEALKRPVLGWSRWDWWRNSGKEERPWGLFSLVLGMYGLVGWGLLVATLTIPIGVFLHLGSPRLWIASSRASAAALAGSLALNDLDAILNSNLILLFLAVAGGLIGLKSHAEQASAWIRRTQATFQ